MLYRGRPLTAAPRPDFCRRNQMVFQNPYLAVNPVFSVRQIIAEPLRTLKAAPPRLDAIHDEGIAGEKIAEVLRRVDKVAYVRFASVYRQFEDVGDFIEEARDVIERLLIQEERLRLQKRWLASLKRKAYIRTY